eukprot:632829-Pyramimonas_sp.AAC.1
MYYALDLGGTNFRMLRVELNGKGAPPKFAIKEVRDATPTTKRSSNTIVFCGHSARNHPHTIKSWPFLLPSSLSACS